MLVRVAARLLAQRRLVPTVSNVNSLPIRTLVPQRSFAAAAVTKTTRATKGATKPRAKSTAKPKTTKAKAKAKPKKKTSIKAEAKPKKRATRAKKTKTPEQIAAAAKKTRLTQIRELRATALKAPHSLPSTAYLVVCSELGKEVKTVAGKEAAAKYKNLIPDELEVHKTPFFF